MYYSSLYGRAPATCSDCRRTLWKAPDGYHYCPVCEKKSIVRAVAYDVLNDCKRHAKDDPQKFQYHPLARRFRRMLRLYWAL